MSLLFNITVFCLYIISYHTYCFFRKLFIVDKFRVVKDELWMSFVGATFQSPVFVLPPSSQKSSSSTFMPSTPRQERIKEKTELLQGARLRFLSGIKYITPTKILMICKAKNIIWPHVLLLKNINITLDIAGENIKKKKSAIISNFDIR